MALDNSTQVPKVSFGVKNVHHSHGLCTPRCTGAWSPGSPFCSRSFSSNTRHDARCEQCKTTASHSRRCRGLRRTCSPTPTTTPRQDGCRGVAGPAGSGRGHLPRPFPPPVHWLAFPGRPPRPAGQGGWWQSGAATERGAAPWGAGGELSAPRGADRERGVRVLGVAEGS